MKTPSSVSCLLALPWLLAGPLVSSATTLTVTNLADSGPGTLRQAIADAAPGDTITFATNGTITVTSGSLLITNSLSIAGPGPASLAVDGNVAYRVFNLGAGLTSSISGLTIQNGRELNGGGLGNFGTMVLSNCLITGNGATGAGGFGGAIHNGPSGVLSLFACTLTNNFAGFGATGGTGQDGTISHHDGYTGGTGLPGGNGGGIYNEGVLALTACTILRNSAGLGGFGGQGGNGWYLLGNYIGNGGQGGTGGVGGAGGGVFNSASGTLSLTNCTILNNSGGEGGDGGHGGSGLNGGALLGYVGNGGDGGGIYNASSVSGVLLIACTATANYSGDPGPIGTCCGSYGAGAGIKNAGLLVLTNTIVAANVVGNDYRADIDGSFSGANNLISGDPLLAVLGNYGGPTQTMTPLPGSPAIDAGSDSVTNFLATDQRGHPRKIGAHVDIGAVEYLAGPLVTTTADSGAGSLRDTVTFSTNGTTVTFAQALSGRTNILTSGQVTIYSSLAIDASALTGGFKISGNRSNRIFEVSTGTTVTLNSLFLMNGYADSGGSGGAILVDGGGTLTLTNCTVSSNSATGVGGGIGNSGGVVNINNSTLSGNAAAYAGAIESDGGTLTINASTLSGNIATNNGGAIDNDGATLWVNNSTFSGNSAGGGGGGIENYGGTAIINSSTFSGNSAGGAAGINNFATLALTNTIVAGNTAPIVPNLNLDSSGSFTGTNNLIDGDPLLAPLGSYGGPTPTMPPQPGSPAIDGGLDSVTNFLATDQRGTPRRFGVHVDIGAVESQLFGVSSLNDSGPGSLRDTINAGQSVIGFAANLDGRTITLTNSQIVITNNVTIDASALPDGLGISGNNSSRIFEVMPGATVTLDSLGLFNGNAASGAGGAIRVDAGGILTVIYCNIAFNSATDGGGLANYGTLTLQGTSVGPNQARGNGGGLVNYGTLTLQGTEVGDNEASGSGGGIENEGGTLTINTGTQIGRNTATYGGGIASRFPSATVSVIQSTLLFNQATNNAGGIANTNGSTLTLVNATVSVNSAGGAGGGLEVMQAAVTSINSTISANSAASAGGINNYGTLVFTNTIVAGNTAVSGSTNIFTGPGGSFTGAYNLTNGNPLLASLEYYGAGPHTSPPLHGSPAIDAGLDSVTNALPTDARGYPRLSGSHVDIGAAEAQWAAPGNRPLLTNPARAANGTFSFSFTSASVADFTVLGSSNVALPLGQWSVLDGAPSPDSPGQYHFTDSTAPNYPRRFYRVVSP